MLGNKIKMKFYYLTETSCFSVNSKNKIKFKIWLITGSTIS